MLKINPPQENPENVVLALAGDLTRHSLPVLMDAIAAVKGLNKLILLDFRQVTLVDREAMEFLCEAKRSGVVAAKCPSYVLRWIDQEHGESNS